MAILIIIAITFLILLMYSLVCVSSRISRLEERADAERIAQALEKESNNELE